MQLMDFSPAFLRAAVHAMDYEVGPFFNANDKETKLGLIATREQRRKVGYTNDPVDAGGETKFGVSKRANPELNIATLTWEQALEVYYKKYWLAAGCQLLTSPRVAILHFDGAINHGITREGEFIQEVAGITGAQRDGDVGPYTAKLVNAMNEFDVCRLLCDRREKKYRDIVAAKPSQVRFLDGWLRRINEMRDFVRGPMA